MGRSLFVLVDQPEFAVPAACVVAPVADDAYGLAGWLFSLRWRRVIFSAAAAKVRCRFVADIGPVSYSPAVVAYLMLLPEGVDPKDAALIDYLAG